MNRTVDRLEFSAGQAWLRSLLIVAYFIVAAVIIPSMILEAGLLAEAPGDVVSEDTWNDIRNLIGTGVWLAAFGFGVWGLRRLQQRGVI